MIDLTQFISDNFLIGLLIIFINGVITGLAVYIGSHAGKRTVDKFKRNDIQEVKETVVEKKVEQQKEIEKNILEKGEEIVRENTNTIWEKGK